MQPSVGQRHHAVKPQQDWRGALAYATSKDGLQWERPTLDVAPPTNQVVKGLVGDSGAVVLDLDTDNPAQRYKMFHRECNRAIGMGVGPGNSLVSADGIHWSESVKSGPVGDRSTMFNNPFRKRWVYNIRSSMRGRTRHYREHADFLAGAQWMDDEAVFWCCADHLDATDPTLSGVFFLALTDAHPSARLVVPLLPKKRPF